MLGTVCAQTPQIEILPAPSVDSVGLKPAAFKNWGNDPFDVMIKIVEHLTTDRSNAHVDEMTARVLTASTEFADTKNKGDWLGLRLKGLFNLGRFQTVVELVDKIEPASQIQRFLPIYFNALLMQNDMGKACAVSAKQEDKDSFWQQADVLCQAFGTDVEKARLAYELWRERNPRDTVFSGLIAHQLYGTAFLVEKVHSVAPMEAFLIQKTGVKGIALDVRPAFMKPVVVVKNQPGFKNAVNLKTLMQRWQKQKIDRREMILRIVQLASYLNVFYPDVRLLNTSFFLDETVTDLPVSPYAVLLPPQAQLTGGGVLMALSMIQENVANSTIAFDVLKAAGLADLVEQWMLERIS